MNDLFSVSVSRPSLNSMSALSVCSVLYIWNMEGNEHFKNLNNHWLSVHGLPENQCMLHFSIWCGIGILRSEIFNRTYILYFIYALWSRGAVLEVEHYAGKSSGILKGKHLKKWTFYNFGQLQWSFNQYISEFRFCQFFTSAYNNSLTLSL